MPHHPLVPRSPVTLAGLAVSLLALNACGAAVRPHTPAPVKARPSPTQHKLSSRSYQTYVTSKRHPHAKTPKRASVQVTIQPKADRACWKVSQLSGIPGPLHITINRGSSPGTGPVVIALGAAYRPSGCQAPIAPALLLEIEQHPREYYITISDKRQPAGAIRGQL